MQGALDAVPGIRNILVTFDRREAVVRYDPQITNIKEIRKAVAATGGYRAGLKYGPIPASGSIVDLANRTEFPLVNAKLIFKHSAFFSIGKAQVNRVAHELEGTGAADELKMVTDDQVVIFASVWADSGTNLLIDWWTGVQFAPPHAKPITPQGWIPLAQHMEKDGGGSKAGLLIFQKTAHKPERGRIRLIDISGELTYRTAEMPVY